MNPFLIINAITGLTLVIAGLLMTKYPPKTINSLYGYRTKQSMSTQEKWDFAQVYSAKRLLISGLVMIAIGLVGLFIDMTETQAGIIGVIIVLLACFFPLIATEKALRQLED